LFSPFEALLPDERALTRMLGYLFDQRQGHGQCTDFLKQFLRLINCDQPLGEALIQTEYLIRTNGRYMDVLITLSDGYRIGLENKAWGAGEQQDQCLDYCEALERLKPGRWLFIFLTPDGVKPKTLGKYENDPRIKRLKCDDLAEALTTDCAALLPFLADLKRFVCERINGEIPLHAGEKEMIDKLLEAGNIDVTVEIVARAREIRRELLKAFKEAMVARLREEFKDKHWEAELLIEKRTVPDLDEAWSGLYFFKPAWRERFAIGFSNAQRDAKSVIFGVYYWGRVPGTSIAGGTLQNELNQALGYKAKFSPCWDWYGSLVYLDMPRYANWYDGDVIRRMALNGGKQMVEDLFPHLRRVIEIGEHYIDQEVARPG